MKILKNNIELNKLGISVFILIYCGMYYSMFQTWISLSYVILFICFIYSIIKHKKIIHLDYFLMISIFFIYSFFSSLWAFDYQYTINQIILLFKAAFIPFILINCMYEKKELEWAIKILMFAGIVFGIIYISQIDLSMLGAYRLMTDNDNEDILPNLNIVSIPVSFACIYYLFVYLKERRILSLLLSLLSLIIVLLLGSRKSILTIILGVILLMFKLDKEKKLRVAFICLISILSISLIIPADYLDFVIDRLLQLLYIKEDNLLDNSDLIRKQFLENGFEYFQEHPFIGQGYYNFSQLFKVDYGVAIYSHNNFIEVIVGGGIIGFVLYYIPYYKIIRNIGLCKNNLDLYYVLLILTFIMLFNHTAIVLLQDQYTWMLIAIAYCYSKTKKEFFL